MTNTAKITDKLSILYCQKASDIMNLYTYKYLGINCPDSLEFPFDGDLQIILLEYYNMFKGDDLDTLVEENKCLKSILNG